MAANSIIFSLLLFTTLASVAGNLNDGNSPSESFLHCFLNRTGSSETSTQFIYTPNTTSFDTILRSSIQNTRFLSAAATKPAFIVQPAGPADVRAAVACGRGHGLRIRVRSGGHDYEGLSYVSAGGPFAILDLSNLRSVAVDADGSTAWVGAGATVGEVYYSIAAKNRTAGFPAGTCATVGVGGQFSGGGIGMMMRKHGTAADNIVDALMVDAKGELLNRASMGEDLFWAIRGGGAASLGVVLYYKIRLVHVPPKVTVFSISRTLKQGATKLVERWQHVAPKLVDDLLIRAIAVADDDDDDDATALGKRTIRVTFPGMFLGRQRELLSVMNESFSELGAEAKHCSEVSWMESAAYFAGYSDMNSTMLLERRPQYNSSSFKAKSDFVRKPISEKGWKGIWRFMAEAKDEPVVMIMEPWGGRMDEIAETAIAFPHRKGNLFNIQYFIRWTEGEEAASEKHLGWMRRFHEYMSPHVSRNPRAAYLNYRDIDLGSSSEEGRTSYSQATAWGRKYYLNNFERLAKVKAQVDPESYFWNEQSIPPFSA